MTWTVFTLERLRTWELLGPHSWMPGQLQSGAEGPEDCWRTAGLPSTLEGQLGSDVSEEWRQLQQCR